MGPRNFVIALGVFSAAVLIPLSPRIAWHTQNERERTIVILDKTVPDQSYREHAGLVWLLNHHRIVQGSGNRKRGATFDRARDYAGHLPASGKLRELQVDPASADLVYVTDTYGVYADDGGRTERGENAAGSNRVRAGSKAPKLIHGGVQPRELDAIVAGLRRGGTLIAEFNTLADPSSQRAREQLGALVGVRATGWFGRHYSELGQGGELPGWVRDAWERRSKRAWPFAGGGYVLAHADGRIVVLREGEDIERRGVDVSFPAAARKRWNIPAHVSYDGWLEIVTPRKGATVEASYRLRVRSSGAAKLRNTRLPREFPAIISTTSEPRRTLYFAGDWADSPSLPKKYDRAGLVRWRARTAPADRRDSSEAFFWRVYAPIMRELITAPR